MTRHLSSPAPRLISPGTGRTIALVVLIGGAVGCALLAALVPTATWVGWFHHEAREPVPQTTLQGAWLWRMMLGTLAVALAACAVLVRRTAGARTASADLEHHAVDQRPDRLSVEAWLVLGVLILAVVPRAFRLGESLWYDEAAMWLTYGLAGAGAIVGNYFDPVNHIAHTLLTWLSVQVNELVMGFELALRLPAVMLSLLAVPMVFALCRLAFSARVSLVAAGMMAVLPVAVFHGVEARGYSMMILLTAASTWALVQARATHRPELWLLYAVLAALTVWTHMVAVCVFLGHGLWIAWTAWRGHEMYRGLEGAAALGLAALMTLTLYAPVLPEVAQQLRGDFRLAADAQEGVLLGHEGLRTLWQVGGAWTWWAALPGLALVALGWAWLWRERGAAAQTPPTDAARQREVMALLWLGFPIALVLVAVMGTWVYARFTAFVLPAAALTMALGVEMLWRWRREAAVAALALVVTVSAVEVFGRPPKQPLREAATFVQRHRTTNEQVLTIDIAHAVMRMYSAGLPMSHSMMHGRDLPERLEAHAPTWIIVLYPEHLEPAAAAAMREHGYDAVQRLAGWDDWGDVVIHRRR